MDAFRISPVGAPPDGRSFIVHLSVGLLIVIVRVNVVLCIGHSPDARSAWAAIPSASGCCGSGPTQALVFVDLEGEELLVVPIGVLRSGGTRVRVATICGKKAPAWLFLERR